MAKAKYTVEEKVHIVEEYLSGEGSYNFLTEKYGVGHTTLNTWVRTYQERGKEGLLPRQGNSTYTSDFKARCVEAVLRREGSVDDIVAKYNISSSYTLRSWIKRYNANKELKDYNPKREVYMADARRKTTPEERKEITEYCIAHDKDYKGTAALYDVSYNQVYTWVQKYLSDGKEGLLDKRGHHKTDDEVDELERLRRENLRLKRQLEERDMLVELLKKVKEFEGM